MPQILAALLGGVLLTTSLAPLNIWPAGIAGIALLAWALHGSKVKTAFFLGWLFGIGLFGSGASWVYVSIHQFGNASVWLAGFLTVLWCAGLGLLGGVFGALLRWLDPGSRYELLIFPALWVLSEWLRTWLLTGFPWLFAGYAHVDGPLQGLAPVGGVLLISYVIALSAVYALRFAALSRQARITAGVALLIFWACGLGLKPNHWTESSGEHASVALVQANIDQNEKWRRDKFAEHIRLQQRLSQPLWNADVLIWPEAAIPALHQRVGPLLEQIQAQAESSQTTFVTGIPYRDPQTGAVYNAIASLGEEPMLYFKRRLVPFGEFMPLEALLRGLIDFFDLPMSSFSAGAEEQAYLKLGRYTASALICYEAVYLDTVPQAGQPPPDLLLTISNDTWFGSSFGPLQHLQMAQMRALEWGRSMARGTNNGVSALIDADGRLLQQTEQFKQQVIQGELEIRSGMTPYARFSFWPILTLSFSFILLAMLLRRQ